MNLFIWLVISIISTILIIKGSEWLEDSSIIIAKEYEVPSVVRGSIITAFGSSFPELSTVVIATLLHGEFELGMSVVIGSAIFNIMVIPAISSISSSGLKLQGNDVKREMGLYSVVVVIMGLFFIASEYLFSNSKMQEDTVLSPEIAFLLIILYILYVLYQWKLTIDSENKDNIESVDSLKKKWMFLLIGLLFIGVGVEGLVRSVLIFGEILGVPNFFWGVVVVAGASSLPDAFVSMRQAGDEYDSASIANVAGSNIFDLLFVVSIGVIIAGGASVSLSVNIPLLLILLCFTLLVVLFISRNEELTVNESYVILILYIMFVIWIILEAFSVINIIY